jgi:hypothetical protein
MLSLINKKIDKITDIINSKEYEEADKLMKGVNKMKDDVKKYCQKNDLTMIETEKSIVSFTKRNINRCDTTLLDPDVRESITVKTQSWWSDYNVL